MPFGNSWLTVAHSGQLRDATDAAEASRAVAPFRRARKTALRSPPCRCAAVLPIRGIAQINESRLGQRLGSRVTSRQTAAQASASRRFSRSGGGPTPNGARPATRPATAPQPSRAAREPWREGRRWRTGRGVEPVIASGKPARSRVRSRRSLAMSPGPSSRGGLVDRSDVAKLVRRPRQRQGVERSAVFPGRRNGATAPATTLRRVGSRRQLTNAQQPSVRLTEFPNGITLQGCPTSGE